MVVPRPSPRRLAITCSAFQADTGSDLPFTASSPIGSKEIERRAAR